MNNVVLIGRLTADPELRFLPGTGRAVANFTLAVDKDLSKDKRQEFEQKGKPTADFIRIVVWGRQAENVANYMSKGKLVGVQGRIQTRTYESNEGHRAFIVEVVAEKVQFLEYGKKGQANDAPDGFDPVDDEDIPF